MKDRVFGYMAIGMCVVVCVIFYALPCSIVQPDCPEALNAALGDSLYWIGGTQDPDPCAGKVSIEAVDSLLVSHKWIRDQWGNITIVRLPVEYYTEWQRLKDEVK